MPRQGDLRRFVCSTCLPGLLLTSWLFFPNVSPASDENWDSSFGLPFLQGGGASALAIDNSGNFFLGGTFSRVALVAATNIARWDGTNWSALGLGLNGQVKAILAVGTNLYAGGTFTSAGGNAATNLARWDGTSWWPVGGGILGAGVRTLTSDGSSIYVGGVFTNAGGTSVRHVAKWNGDTWADLQGGVGGENSEVDALLWSGGQLTVGGRFSSAGPALATNIARWNGSDWNGYGPGLPGAAYSLAVDRDGAIYASGGEVVPPESHYIANWTGSQWFYFPCDPGSLDQSSRRIFVYQNELYVTFVPFFPPPDTAARWSGNAWVPFKMPFYPSMRTVEHNGTLYAVGPLNNMMAPGQGGLAKYDGTNWTILTAGGIGSVRTLKVVQGQLFAGGRFSVDRSADPSLFNEVAGAWDGHLWSPIAQLRAPTICSHCRAWGLEYAHGMLYVAGAFPTTNGFSVPQVATWDGTNWSNMPTPNTVRCVAADSTSLYAGGDFGIARWDNITEWTSFGGTVTGIVQTIAINNDNDIVIGGSFTNIGSVTAVNLARWNGATWSGLSSGINGPVFATIFRGNELIVGGAFSTAGGTSASCVAVWRNEHWEGLGTGFTENLPSDGPTVVNALAVTANGTLYAAGNFKKADGKNANFIAYWDGDEWQPLGSGLSGTAYALAANGDDLYVGGDFGSAGGKSSSGFALWHGGSLVERPRLTIQRLGSQVIISWPISASNYFLQYSTSLSAPSWSPLPGSVEGDRNFATNNVTDPTRFYRLRKN